MLNFSSLLWDIPKFTNFQKDTLLRLILPHVPVGKYVNITAILMLGKIPVQVGSPQYIGYLFMLPNIFSHRPPL